MWLASEILEQFIGLEVLVARTVRFANHSLRITWGSTVKEQAIFQSQNKFSVISIITLASHVASHETNN
jgi:hypothetical protein